ncbi:MAG TPA: SdrD B-like domain-containing protein, partial [Chitinophagales bacterium]|nr:SdrD B-like domain-containing protein [Chitinophagales bacterium]
MLNDNNFLRKVLLLSLMLTCFSAHTYAQVSGTVFRDYDVDGTKDTNEPSVMGVTVTAYDASGSIVSNTTSASNGSYSFSGLTLPLRIEFTNLGTDNYPSFYGNSNNTSVQFYSSATTTAHFGIGDIGSYCPTNSSVVVPKMVFGQISLYPDSAAIILNDMAERNHLIPELSINADEILATFGEVGCLYGQAFDKLTQNYYFSAYLKRYSGFGPGNVGAEGSPGAIYKIDAARNIAVLLDLPASEIGTNPHPSSIGTSGFLSDPTWWEVGKMSWGDIDISDDGTKLYAMNLYNRKLYEISTSNGAVLNSYPIPGITGGVPFTSPSGSSDDLRPFAVKYYQGKVYIGVVCSAESEYALDTNLGFNLHHQGFVFEFTPGSGFNGTPVSTIQLSGDPNVYTYLEGVKTSWNMGYTMWYSQEAWLANNLGWSDWHFVNYHREVIADIEFLNGDMIIGLKDLVRDQFAGQEGTKFPDGTTPVPDYAGTGGARGHVLKACFNGSTWTIENNGICGGVAGYNSDNYFNQVATIHTDGDPMTSLAVCPAENTVIGTVIPGDNVAGYGFFDNATGVYDGTRINDVYRDVMPGFNDLFGKSSGLGDIEVVSSPPPLEIGNRVWTDTDEDGVQDANEAGIDGITVQLYEGSTLVGTTSTTDGGQWYFNDSNTTGGLKPNTAYTVRVLSTAFPSGQTLTLVNNDGTSNGDLRDSDASLVGGNAEIAYTTSGYGQNDHTLDIGFRIIPDLSLTKTVSNAIVALN